MITIHVERAPQPEGCTLAGVNLALAEMFENVAPLFSSSPELLAKLPPGTDVDIHLVLGGEDQCYDWDVDSTAIGFHAVASSRREADGEGDDDWYEVAARHEIHVNLDAMQEACREEREAGASDFDKSCSIASLLQTVPHEILHCLEWIAASGNRTPLEVFDQDGAEFGLLAVQKLIGDNEDDVEEQARSITDAVVGDTYVWVDRIEGMFVAGPGLG